MQLICAAFIGVRASLPRKRFDQLVLLCWKYLFPLVLALVLALVSLTQATTLVLLPTLPEPLDSVAAAAAPLGRFLSSNSSDGGNSDGEKKGKLQQPLSLGGSSRSRWWNRPLGLHPLFRKYPHLAAWGAAYLRGQQTFLSNQVGEHRRFQSQLLKMLSQGHRALLTQLQERFGGHLGGSSGKKLPEELQNYLLWGQKSLLETQQFGLKQWESEQRRKFWDRHRSRLPKLPRTSQAPLPAELAGLVQNHGVVGLAQLQKVHRRQRREHLVLVAQLQQQHQADCLECFSQWRSNSPPEKLELQLDPKTQPVLQTGLNPSAWAEAYREDQQNLLLYQKEEYRQYQSQLLKLLTVDHQSILEQLEGEFWYYGGQSGEKLPKRLQRLLLRGHSYVFRCQESGLKQLESRQHYQLRNCRES